MQPDPQPTGASLRVAALYVETGGGINSGECVGRRKIEKREASATPPAFRDVLLDLARRSAQREGCVHAA